MTHKKTHAKTRDRARERAREDAPVRAQEQPDETTRPSSHERPKKKLTGRIVIGVSIALVLVFVIFLFITTNFLSSNMLVTETAYRSVAYDVVKTTALVVRDEEYIPASTAGVLKYSIVDGDKVTAGGTIATAYRNESDVVRTLRIQELDEKIGYLESLNELTRSSNIGLDTVNSQLREKLVTLLDRLNTRSFSSVPAAEEELMTSILRKQILTGEQGKFDARIEQLKQEKASLESSVGAAVGKVTSPSSGYFVSSVDGYEHSVALDSLSDLTYADYRKITAEEVNPDAYLGKVIHGVNWYLVCPMAADQAANISHYTTEVSVRMPYALSQEIPAKVMYVNFSNNDDQAIVVLRCNYMNEALSKIRNETIEIVVNSYEGLKISKSAIHDGELTRTVTDEHKNQRTESKVVQGVYVEYGNELRFRQIVIVYAGEDYVIVNETPDPKLLFTGSTVKLYDQVITEGGDLYDGKLYK